MRFACDSARAHFTKISQELPRCCIRISQNRKRRARPLTTKLTRFDMLEFLLLGHEDYGLPVSQSNEDMVTRLLVAFGNIREMTC